MGMMGRIAGLAEKASVPLEWVFIRKDSSKAPQNDCLVGGAKLEAWRGCESWHGMTRVKFPPCAGAVAVTFP